MPVGGRVLRSEPQAEGVAAGHPAAVGMEGAEVVEAEARDEVDAMRQALVSLAQPKGRPRRTRVSRVPE